MKDTFSIDKYTEGLQLFLDKKYKEALKSFSLIELDTLSNFDEGLIHQYKALCYTYLRKLKKGEQEFLLALKYRPNYSKIHLDMGLMHYFSYDKNKVMEYFLRKLKKKNRLEKALACFEEGILIDVYNAGLWYYRGYMLELLGKESEAKKCFRKSIDFDAKVKNYEKSALFETVKKKNSLTK
jgi:tetratricopeptide (TPR) repeat protein